MRATQRALNGVALEARKPINKMGNEAIDCWVYPYAALQLLTDRSAEIRRAIGQEPDAPTEPYGGDDHWAQSDVEDGGLTIGLPASVAASPAKKVWPAAIADGSRPACLSGA